MEAAVNPGRRIPDLRAIISQSMDKLRKSDKQRKAREILKRLYSSLNFYSTPNFDPTTAWGGLADLAFERQFNSSPVQQKLDKLSSLVDRFYVPVGSELINYERQDGSDYLLRNERINGLSYQEIYLRSQISPGYTAHLLGVERERQEGSAYSVDIGIFITDTNGNIVNRVSFNYWASNRGGYTSLILGLLKTLTSPDQDVSAPLDRRVDPLIAAAHRPDILEGGYQYRIRR